MKAELKEHHRADRGFGLFKRYVKREGWGFRPVRSACHQIYFWIQDMTIMIGFSILFAEFFNTNNFFYGSQVVPSPGWRPHWAGVTGP